MTIVIWPGSQYDHLESKGNHFVGGHIADLTYYYCHIVTSGYAHTQIHTLMHTTALLTHGYAQKVEFSNTTLLLILIVSQKLSIFASGLLGLLVMNYIILQF